MAGGGRIRAALLGALATTCAWTASAHAASYSGDRYGLAQGCYTVQSSGGGYLARSGDTWTVKGAPTDATQFRMKPVTLGRYMLFAAGSTFLATAPDGDGLAVTTDPGPAADWTVDSAGGGRFSIKATSTGTALDGANSFAFTPADDCAVFPEAEENATGTPGTGPTPYSQVSGFIDAHMHWMGYEFLGGDAHCGRPWDPYGVTKALAGCASSNALNPVVETVLGGGSPSDDPVGWPTFKDWPAWDKLTHEQSYYKWVERAWRGGLRVFVNLFVENNALCELYQPRRNSCNEMDSVRLQAKDLRALQDYVDAQYGGPGKGWLRIVSDPFQARRVANAGKLAVVPGIEVSNLFDCGIKGTTPTCDSQQVDQRLDEAYNDLGVRDMELINKFDNAFGGVAGDNGSTGQVVNTGNYLETGRFWDMKTCTGPDSATEHDRLQTSGPIKDPALNSLVGSLIPGGTTPVYPPGPHCNQRPLTSLGEHLVRRMIDKRMIIDPDHLDVSSRDSLLSIVESQNYHGIVSSHSWSTEGSYKRILKQGGFVAPYAGDSTSYLAAYKDIKADADPRYYWGIGYGADMNGFGHQGQPRPGNEANPVVYPFKSFDGKVTFDREKTGDRVFDINKDGVAHYGLYPDWIEDLRKIGGDQVVTDMSHGAEAYLEMWERGVGVAPDSTRNRRLRFTKAGIGYLKMGVSAEELLRGAGQPHSRIGRVWSYEVKHGGAMRALFSPDGHVAAITSTAHLHRYHGIGTGSKAPKGAPRNGRFKIKLSASRTIVYGIRNGRVRYTAVMSPTALKKIGYYLKLARL